MPLALFVWTLQDVIGLIFLMLISLLFGGAYLWDWLRSRKR